MKKSYVVGGLAIVGAIALFAYLKPKPKKNSEGFFSANGKMGSASGRLGSGSSLTAMGSTAMVNCTVCYSNYSDNNNYQSTYYAINGRCRSGDTCKR